MERENKPPEHGPSLATYLETRLNLLAVAIKEARDAHELALLERDRRYAQQHEDQERRWTDRAESDREAVKAAFIAASAAIHKVEAATEKRFESVNEFRSTLSDQQRTFIPRAEVEVMRESMNDKVLALASIVDRIQAERAGIRGGWGYAVGVAGLVALLIGLWVTFRR